MGRQQEFDPGLFERLPHSRVHQAGIGWIMASARERHVPRPGIPRMDRSLDQQQLEVVGLLSQDDGHGRRDDVGGRRTLDFGGRLCGEGGPDGSEAGRGHAERYPRGPAGLKDVWASVDPLQARRLPVGYSGPTPRVSPAR